MCAPLPPSVDAAANDDDDDYGLLACLPACLGIHLGHAAFLGCVRRQRMPTTATTTITTETTTWRKVKSLNLF